MVAISFVVIMKDFESSLSRTCYMNAHPAAGFRTFCFVTISATTQPTAYLSVNIAFPLGHNYVGTINSALFIIYLQVFEPAAPDEWKRMLE